MSIAAAYNEWANQYDSNSNKTRDLDRETTALSLTQASFLNVIELGCGTGKNTEFLLSKADKVIGIDFSDEMLKKAKAKFATDRVTFQQADILDEWHVSDNFADLITCNLVLEHIEDLEAIFKQAAKKLKSGGLLFISELHPFKQYTGSKARFDTETGTKELTTFVHHVSEYLTAAANCGFQLTKLNEWFDESSTEEAPRLLSLELRLTK